MGHLQQIEIGQNLLGVCGHAAELHFLYVKQVIYGTAAAQMPN